MWCGASACKQRLANGMYSVESVLVAILVDNRTDIIMAKSTNYIRSYLCDIYITACCPAKAMDLLLASNVSSVEKDMMLGVKTRSADPKGPHLTYTCG